MPKKFILLFLQVRKREMSRTKVDMYTKCMCIFPFHYAKVWIQLVHISQQRIKKFIWIKLMPNMSTSSTRTRVISELLMSLAILISSPMVVLSRRAALLTLKIVRYVKLKLTILFFCLNTTDKKACTIGFKSC